VETAVMQAETTEKPSHGILTKLDRCDHGNCPAQAFVLIKFETGSLYFCGHHFNKVEASIYEKALDIIDERDTINPKSESSA
jgi:hypothetical protein